MKTQPGRPVSVTESEAQRIKELFDHYGKFRTVAKIVNRDALTVKRVLGVKPKIEKTQGYFNWSDFNYSVIL